MQTAIHPSMNPFSNIYLSPDFQCVFAEFSPANQGRNTDACCVEPDKEERQEGGEGGGEGELPVLGDHHVALEGQHCEGDDGLDPCQLHSNIQQTYLIQSTSD